MWNLQRVFDVVLKRFHIDAMKFIGQNTIQFPQNGAICYFKNYEIGKMT